MNLSDKTKYFNDILIIVVILLVGLSSFELGKLSQIGSNNNDFILNYTEDGINKTEKIDVLNKNKESLSNKILKQSENLNNKNYFASKRGHKYYTINCSSGKNIKLTNRIYFSTKEEALKAGYELSSSCKDY